MVFFLFSFVLFFLFFCFLTEDTELSMEFFDGTYTWITQKENVTRNTLHTELWPWLCRSVHHFQLNKEIGSGKHFENQRVSLKEEWNLHSTLFIKVRNCHPFNEQPEGGESVLNSYIPGSTWHHHWNIMWDCNCVGFFPSE